MQLVAGIYTLDKHTDKLYFALFTLAVGKPQLLSQTFLVSLEKVVGESGRARQETYCTTRCSKRFSPVFVAILPFSGQVSHQQKNW